MTSYVPANTALPLMQPNSSDGDINTYQFNKTYVTWRWEPERHLMFAILEDAVQVVATGPGHGAAEIQLWKDARQWVALRDERYIFSFDNVWGMLFGSAGWSLEKARAVILNDPARVARGLKRLRGAKPPLIGDEG